MSREVDSYCVVEGGGLPWPLVAPRSKAEDEIWREGAATLSEAAARVYNASVERLRERDVSGALAHAERALELMPYSPYLLEYAAMLAVAHGDFDLAARVLRSAQVFGLDELASVVRSELEQHVQAWNEAVDDPQRLVARHGAGDSEPSYRELLLIDSLDGSVESPRLHKQLIAYGIRHEPPAPAPRPSGARARLRSSLALVLLALVAFMVGGVGGWFLGSEDDLPESDAGVVTGDGGDGAGVLPDTSLERGDPETVASPGGPMSEASSRALRALSDGEINLAATLVAALETDGYNEGIAAMESLVSEALVEAAQRAWGRKEYERVVSTLSPLDSLDHVRHPEGLYYLGVAAGEVGRDSLAFRALTRYVSSEASREAPHYRAQAAYSAARLGDGPAAARAARVIADEFRDTIYYNSVIRERLSDGNER